MWRGMRWPEPFTCQSLHPPYFLASDRRSYRRSWYQPCCCHLQESKRYHLASSWYGRRASICRKTAHPTSIRIMYGIDTAHRRFQRPVNPSDTYLNFRLEFVKLRARICWGGLRIFSVALSDFSFEHLKRRLFCENMIQIV